MTFGLVGIGIDMVGTFVIEDDGVVMVGLCGREETCRSLPLPRAEWKRLL